MNSIFNYILFTFLSLIACAASGQSVDSLSEKPQIKIITFQKTDSLSGKINDLKKSSVLRIDSIVIVRRIDQLKDTLKLLNLSAYVYQNKFDSLSRILRQKLQHRNIDSASLKLSNKTHTGEDSLQTRILKQQTAVQHPFTNKELNSRARDKNLSIAQLPGINANIPSIDTKLGKNISGINSDAKILNAPKVKILPKRKNVNREMAQLEEVPKKEVKNLGITKEVDDVKKETKELSAVTSKAEIYKKDIKNISTDDAAKVKALPKDIEKEAINRSELQGLNKSVKQAEATKNVLTDYQDAIKKIDTQSANKVLKNANLDPVPDYFATQQAALQAGIKQLEKLKKKYGSIPDSRYLPKHPPSEMKGKPLIERLVPGLNFQFFQQSGITMTDISPFVMYRFTSRWRAGVGGTYRLQFNNKVQPVHLHDAFGYRVMMDYHVSSGFNLHGEGEWMKTVPYDPISAIKITDSEKKIWIPGLYLGVLKHYKVSPRINGNFQVLYNFLYQRNGVYPNRFNIRFGFEFNLKKK